MSGIPFVCFFFSKYARNYFASEHEVFPLTIRISKLSRSKVQHSACIIFKLCKAIVKKVYFTRFYRQT